MSSRRALLGLAALACLAAPAPAGEFDKYLPENSQFYVQVKMPRLFESEMVRNAVPMIFDKYGDQIAMFAGMAKQINPQAPDIPEDQLKDAIKKMSDKKEIAAAFDAAKNIISDVVIAGSGEPGGVPEVVVLVKCQFINAQALEMAMGFAKQAGAQMPITIEPAKKGKGTVYAMTVQQNDQKFYMSVPAEGILQISMSEKLAESAFEAKGKPGEKLAGLMGKRGDKDFVFVAATGKDDAEYTSMSANVVLDKDLAGTFNATYKDAAKAAEQAKKMNEQFAEMAGKLNENLGDKAAALKPHVEKSKATASGNTVNATFSLPGTAVETLLKKD
jgi:hypothetical protein